MGPRVVLDTHVFISGFGWGGKPEACVEQDGYTGIRYRVGPPRCRHAAGESVSNTDGREPTTQAPLGA
jgi:hypothetical protein